jgi:cysteine desulfurase
MVYLDWNATAPLSEVAIAAMTAAMGEGWANPASVHGPGRSARRYVEDARAAVARVTGTDARDVTLTSGGTEANNLALRSLRLLPAVGSGPPQLIVSRIEHPSIVRTAQAMADDGLDVVWLEPGADGRIDPAALERALTSRSASQRLVSVQAVNHETGVLQPLIEVAALCRAHGAFFHCDAVQAVGRLPEASHRGADLTSIASHKLRGPKGIGALATVCGIKLAPLLRGGEQERGVRPGTQDPIAAAGFGAVLNRPGGASRYAALGPLRDQLEAAILETTPGAEVNGARAHRAPHVLNISIPGWLGPELAAALDLEGVAVSSGSACSAGTADPSPVITAMVGVARARSALRISLGETTTSDQIAEAIASYRRVFARGSR